MRTLQIKKVMLMVCKNCGGKIVKLEGEWYHLVEDMEGEYMSTLYLNKKIRCDNPEPVDKK